MLTLDAKEHKSFGAYHKQVKDCASYAYIGKGEDQLCLYKCRRGSVIWCLQ